MKVGSGQRSYAVTWLEGDGAVRVGKLELSPQGLRLEGGGSRGRLYSLSFFYRDLTGVRIARTAAERLGRRPTLVIERSSRPPIRIASVEGLGMTTEVFEGLAPLIAAAG